jgi:hypothetical protein
MTLPCSWPQEKWVDSPLPISGEVQKKGHLYLILFFPSVTILWPTKGCFFFSQFDFSPGTKICLVSLYKVLFLLIIPVGLAELHFLTHSHGSE